MEVDEIQTQAIKYQRIGENSSNPNKIGTVNVNHRFLDDDGGGGGGRMCGWPSSRIVRVSRASGGKDRHSKVLTSKGLRDRRVRLSVTTAIQFYDLQDRLGYDQPSKAVEWLIKAAASSISELPSLDPSFSAAAGINHHEQSYVKESTGNDDVLEDINNTYSKSSGCSSTSETSKGSGLSLTRSENRIRARERAREMAVKNKKEKEMDSVRVPVVNHGNGISTNSSFTDLLTGGINSTTAVSPNSTASQLDYFLNRHQQSSLQIQPQHFNNHHHQFSFLPENFSPAVTTGGGGEESYNLNFSIASASSGFNRGTLQSNLMSILPQNHHNLQRFQPPSMADGSTSTNFPFFVAPGAPDHFPAAAYDSQRLQLYGGSHGGVRQSDHHKEKSKN